MAEPKRLSSGRWKVRYRDPLGRPRSKVCNTKGEARAYAEEIGHAARRREWTAPELGRMLLADWVAKYTCTVVHRRPTTLCLYEREFEHVLRRFGQSDATDPARAARNPGMARRAPRGRDGRFVGPSKVPTAAPDPPSGGGEGGHCRERLQQRPAAARGAERDALPPPRAGRRTRRGHRPLVADLRLHRVGGIDFAAARSSSLNTSRPHTSAGPELPRRTSDASGDSRSPRSSRARSTELFPASFGPTRATRSSLRSIVADSNRLRFWSFILTSRTPRLPSTSRFGQRRPSLATCRSTASRSDRRRSAWHLPDLWRGGQALRHARSAEERRQLGSLGPSRPGRDPRGRRHTRPRQDARERHARLSRLRGLH